MKIEATYTNREGEVWDVGGITPHPFTPLAFVMAVRMNDGKQVCLDKHRVTLLPRLTTETQTANEHDQKPNQTEPELSGLS